MTSLALAPTEPTERRKFQLTEFQSNHNKWWQVEVWPLTSQTVRIRTSWGRVGVKAQYSEKEVTRATLERLIEDKKEKGYQEIDLHSPTVIAPTTALATIGAPSAKVSRLVDMIFHEAGETIKSYLAVTVDALSQAQIARGRALVRAVETAYIAWTRGGSPSSGPLWEILVDAVKTYYNTIPTQLPPRLREASVMRQVVLDFCDDFMARETALDQLEAGLSTFRAVGATDSPYDRLGARITELPERSPEYTAIVRFLDQGSRHGYRIRVHDIFEVLIPSERAAYASNTFGTDLIMRLTHGTANANLRHILHEKGAGSGLRIPQTATNGWMFGAGNYFANVASKSVNYTRASARYPRTLLLCDVAVGRLYVPDTDMKHLRSAPSGYHAVWGKAGHTRGWNGPLQYDEFIAYKPEQQTIRYVVTFETAL